eukprot:CAMPEP_0174748846 /NCGR_PEP_ID=MMETSP1094-20130205/94408_1 /TAXON_ID=156173 /ORGANISM="Chrysochromulina brevifilum, Strain UTEX LB 985" /LENGTH=67 /DNA_ID=CAMNT_0015953959 /DNA_START=50 /DNA_END=250 /DNA_ORIENTATION=-
MQLGATSSAREQYQWPTPPNTPGTAEPTDAVFPARKGALAMDPFATRPIYAPFDPPPPEQQHDSLPK